MMTEQKLYQSLDRVNQRTNILRLNRMECSSLLGISDLEYVGQLAHGWIELKVGFVNVRPTPVRLEHEFTPTQAIWLLDHHRPHIRLVSWLLVGVPHHHTQQWEQFVLLTPALAAPLSMREKPTWPSLMAGGAVVCQTALEVLQAVHQGAEE